MKKIWKKTGFLILTAGIVTQCFSPVSADSIILKEETGDFFYSAQMQEEPYQAAEEAVYEEAYAQPSVTDDLQEDVSVQSYEESAADYYPDEAYAETPEPAYEDSYEEPLQENDYQVPEYTELPAEQPDPAAYPEPDYAMVQEPVLTAAAAVSDLGFCPIEITTDIPEQINPEAFEIIRLEIRNITNKTLEQMHITLWSGDNSCYIVTPYRNMEEVNAAINTNTYSETGKENTERVLTVRQLGAGEIINAELIILPKQYISVGKEGLKAELYCEFTADNSRFYRAEKWTMKQKSMDEEPAAEPAVFEEPAADPAEVQPAEDSGYAEPVYIEPAAEEPAVKSASEEPLSEPVEYVSDFIIKEEPGVFYTPHLYADEGAQIEETALLKAEDPADNEVLTFHSDGSTEGEEFTDDWYYDDWTTYYYDGGYGEGAAQINTATPHIIVESYSHKRKISTGDEFPIEIKFLNTSQKLGMESVMVQVETSESLSLANGTNTFFINELSAGGTATQRMNLLAANQCKDPTQKITLSIKFEYVERNERKEGSSTETITLPISQKDRLELKDPSYDEMEAGREGLISIAYVNKGYSQLNNMEASIQLDNAQAVQENIYVGNVDSGKNGTIDFIVTPDSGGEYTGSVTLTYEDSSQQEVALVIPLQFQAMEAFVLEDWSDLAMDLEMEPEETQPSFPWIPVAGGAALVLIIILIIVIVKMKRANAKASSQIDLEDWFGEGKSI